MGTSAWSEHRDRHNTANPASFEFDADDLEDLEQIVAQLSQHDRSRVIDIALAAVRAEAMRSPLA